MLQQGESIVYVQRQFGHASIQLTVDTYGKWLPMGNKGAVDRLDGESGSRTVATGIRGNSPSSIPSIQPSDSSMYFMELYERIEPPTAVYKTAALPIELRQLTHSDAKMRDI